MVAVDHTSQTTPNTSVYPTTTGRPRSRKRRTYDTSAARNAGFSLYFKPYSFAVRSINGRDVAVVYLADVWERVVLDLKDRDHRCTSSKIA